MNQSTPLIITGMHRSGTSLVARFIHHSGIHLGDEFVGAKASNPYGHFEDVEILDFHRDALRHQFGHDLWVPKLPAITPEVRMRARALVDARQTASHWGWKEPRTTLFLDLWHDILPHARYLLLVRQPLLVVDSLHRRTNTRFYHIWRHNKFLRTWLLYNRTLLAFYQLNPDLCLLVTLQDLLHGADQFVALLSDLISYPLDESTFHAVYDASILSRQRTDLLLADPRLIRTSAALYRDMQETSAMQWQAVAAR